MSNPLIGKRVSVTGHFEGRTFSNHLGTIIGINNGDNNVCVAFDEWTEGHCYTPIEDFRNYIDLENLIINNNLWYLPIELCTLLQKDFTYKVYNNTPYDHVIKKIKQMELARHAQGYRTYQL